VNKRKLIDISLENGHLLAIS